MDYDRACGVTLNNWTNHASYLRPIFVKLICWYQKKICQSESGFTNKIDPAELNKLFHMSLTFFVRKNLNIVKGLDRDLKSFALTVVSMF